MRLLGGVLLGVLLCGCQTAGYQSSERVRMDCRLSPLQSDWNNAYTPSYRHCVRATPPETSGYGYLYSRYFEIPGGWAQVFFTEVLTASYVIPVSLGAAMRSFDDIRENASNWGEVRKIEVDRRSFDTITFKMRGKACLGFNSYYGAMPNAPGFHERVHGFGCVNRADPKPLLDFLVSLSADGARAIGAPTNPEPRRPRKAVRTGAPEETRT